MGLENVGSFTLVVLGVLLTTSFLKIFTTLTLLRCGIGINQWEGGVIVTCVSLALTFFIMEPLIPFRKLSDNSDSFPQIISPFLRTHVDSEIYQRLAVLRKSPIDSDVEESNETAIAPQVESPQVDSADSSQQEPVSADAPQRIVSQAGPPADFGLLVASFTISQLRDAFEIGFTLLLPFLIIDLLVMNLLMVLGATAVNVELISIPLKILLFFSVDGWTMISEKLLKEFM